MRAIWAVLAIALALAAPAAAAPLTAEQARASPAQLAAQVLGDLAARVVEVSRPDLENSDDALVLATRAEPAWAPGLCQTRYILTHLGFSEPEPFASAAPVSLANGYRVVGDLKDSEGFSEGPTAAQAAGCAGQTGLFRFFDAPDAATAYTAARIVQRLLHPPAGKPGYRITCNLGKRCGDEIKVLAGLSTDGIRLVASAPCPAPGLLMCLRIVVRQLGPDGEAKLYGESAFPYASDMLITARAQALIESDVVTFAKFDIVSVDLTPGQSVGRREELTGAAYEAPRMPVGLKAFIDQDPLAPALP